MAKSTLKLTDMGYGIKGMNTEPWGGLEGFLQATSTGSGSSDKAQMLKRVLPWLAKATNMTANAVAELPFDLMKGDTVYDSSAEWKDKLGGMPSPKRLIRQVAASLCTGRAYVIPNIMSKAIVDLQYCAPQTVNENITYLGLQDFMRTTDTGKSGRFYPLDGELAKTDTPPGYDGLMMYFWLPDADIEIGPAKTNPAGTALLSSEMLIGIDSTININAQRGFIPPTILAAKGMTSLGEREKAESFWNRFLRGFTEGVAKIINAEAMDVKRVGAGMDELRSVYTEVYTQAIENIGTAFGIPAAVFMSDKAFASEVNPMIKLWYSSSVFVSIYSTIEETFTEQLFDRYGLKMLFRPESIDAFKDDEVEKAGAIKLYVDMGILPSAAFKIAGAELPEGVTPEEIDKTYNDKQAMAERIQTSVEQNNQAKLEQKPVEEKKPMPKPKALHLDGEQLKELNLWRQIATRQYKKSGNKCVDFEVKTLQPDMADSIRRQLCDATNEADIIKAFEVNSMTIQDDGTRALVEAINRATALVEAEGKAVPPTVPNISVTMPAINLVAQMPDPGQGNVIVNVPEQPPPVVNVTNKISPTPVSVNVSPTPVTIDNKVSVEDKPRSAEIKRMPNGDLKINEV